MATRVGLGTTAWRDLGSLRFGTQWGVGVGFWAFIYPLLLFLFLFLFSFYISFLCGGFWVVFQLYFLWWVGLAFLFNDGFSFFSCSLGFGLVLGFCLFICISI